jgi:hypothetical protein
MAVALSEKADMQHPCRAFEINVYVPFLRAMAF